MAVPSSAARIRIGGASLPTASADQSSSQTRNGSPSAPASPSDPRLQRSKERKRPLSTSVTVKWASQACRVAQADARSGTSGAIGVIGAKAERKNVSWNPNRRPSRVERLPV
jgi:hypothetical protein